MKTTGKILFLILPLILFLSCEKKSSKKIITERIRYDVPVKSPMEGTAWWVENIEGSKREIFVKSIINAALKGDIQAYDTDNKAITKEKIKFLFSHSDSVYTVSPNPPYNDTMMVVKKEIHQEEITMVRFLEEWYMDEKTLEFDKKILGIAPVRNNYDEHGAFRGLEVLFWVYFDKEYPAKLQLGTEK
ncbi:MAG: hypothetical protein NTU44_15265 [Bacteroidetes bacterium]|nr:hypothetical protein [Bacteroidota bacterium]